MLRELTNTRQVEGEAPRKWFFSHDLDLVVWFDSIGTPFAFELAYDKYRGEHSITWKRGRGYRHYVVDDGEGTSGSAQTPFMYADGLFDRDRVLEQFLALSAALPNEIRELVAAVLREFQEAKSLSG